MPSPPEKNKPANKPKMKIQRAEFCRIIEINVFIMNKIIT